MRNPQLTIGAVALLLLFTSCQREHILAPVGATTTDLLIETRCCDDLTEDILGNALYQKAWDDLYLGLIEPSINVLQGMDTAYIFQVTRDYEACVLSGKPLDNCAEAFVTALGVKEYIEFINQSIWDSLRLEYAETPNDAFYTSLKEALANSLLNLPEDQRRLDCYLQYKQDLNGATQGIMKVIGASSDAGAIVAAFITAQKILSARAKFCDCMYSKYGYKC